MKIFISWSGHRSQVVAEALREWLVRVIQRLEPWVSSEDIRVGARWQTEIAGVLSHVQVGILCLTPDNLNSQWLHFEAGALAKTIDNATLVCPYLIGMEPSDVPPPLGQFQSKRADYEGTKALIRTINSALGESCLSEEQLSDAYEMYWPRLKKCLDNLPPPDERVVRKRDPQEILEEILSIVRGLARSQSAPREEDQVRLAASLAALSNLFSLSPIARDSQREPSVFPGFKPRINIDNKEKEATAEEGNEE